MYGRIAYALMPKPFPLQSLSHARPRHLPVSRRTIQSLRPHFFPRRELRVLIFSRKKWEHCPHPATDMQPLTRLVAVPTHHAFVDALRLLERDMHHVAETLPELLADVFADADDEAGCPLLDDLAVVGHTVEGGVDGKATFAV